MRTQLLEDAVLLPIVHGLNRVQKRRRITRLGRRLAQRAHVLGKARAAVTGARVYKVIADARIRAHAQAHLLNVGAKMLGDVGNLVHETDLGREHRVGRVLGQLGGAHIHADHAIVIAIKRLVQRLQQLGWAWIVGADNDPIRLHEVADRRPFF